MSGVPWRLVADRRPSRLLPADRAVHELAQCVRHCAGRAGGRRHRRDVCGRRRIPKELRHAGRQGFRARAELHVVRRVHHLLPADVRDTR